MTEEKQQKSANFIQTDGLFVSKTGNLIVKIGQNIVVLKREQVEEALNKAKDKKKSA